MASVAYSTSTVRTDVPSRRLTLGLAAALAVAGLIHSLLAPEHLVMSTLFGFGFLAAGVAQLGMAAWATIRPTRLLYAAVLASTAVLGGTYAYNVLVGLPFQAEPGAVAGAAVAHSEANGHGAEHAAGSDHAHDAALHTAQAAQLDHHDGGIVLGSGEPVDAYGAVTQAAQLTAAAVALALLRRPHGRLPQAAR